MSKLKVKPFMDSNEYDNFIVGRNMRMARRKSNLTQEEAAKTLKIAISTISGYEKGLYPIPLNAFVGMCNLYEVRAEDVLKGMLWYN